jgi:stage III sporulation protein SpoIIIAA
MQQTITDDLGALLAVLPAHIREAVERLDDREDLLEIVLDLGRQPQARFPNREVLLSDMLVTREELEAVVGRIGSFGDDNRAGIERTLHRISALRNRRGEVVGLTCRVGRAVHGTVALIRDVVEAGKSILILGRPGVGKTTLLREAARVLADELGKRVVVVDTSNEIAGDGDVPHPGIGRARRMQVARVAAQHQVMIEAVENHMPEVIIIDEIGTELEAAAARTIAERGVQLVGTAHGRTLDNLLVNPLLADLVGGVQAVTLGDEEARRRGTQKTVLERKSPPTFDVLVEQENWHKVVVHKDVSVAVDSLLRGRPPLAEERIRDEEEHVTRRAIAVPVAETMGSRHSSESLAIGDEFSGARGRRGRTGKSMFYDPRRDAALLPSQEEALAVEMEEPTGTTGAPSQSLAHAAHRRPMRIYPFGISRERLEHTARQLRVPVEISRDHSNVDAIIALKTLYRRQGEQLRDAERARTPVYVLRTNTVAQMSEALAQLFDLRHGERDLAAFDATNTGVHVAANPTTAAMEEAEQAIHELLNSGGDRAELLPQNSYVRRLQHQIAGRYNLESRSIGKEPERRVQIWAR